MTDAVNISDTATTRVKELLIQKDNPDLKLRVYVQGGGCSGFQYGFQFDDERADDDIVVEKDNITLLVDSMSFQYLMGAEIEFKDDILGSRFIVNNPNATTTCGCGSSFGI